MWCRMLSIDTTFPNRKWMDLLEKVTYMKLLFFKNNFFFIRNNFFFILNKFFDILNFLSIGTTFEPFWHPHSCSDNLTLTPHHILVISKLIFDRKKSFQCETKYLVLCAVSKWRVAVGAKQMAPTACPATVWTLGTRWTTLTQNGWVLWFTWYSVCTSFKNTIC